MKLLLFLFFYFLHAALAQSTLKVLATPGISTSHSNKLRLHELSLIISPELISVDYLLENPSEKDLTTVMSFTTPPITAGKQGNKQDFSDFSLFVDGDRVVYKTSILATGFDGKDVSKKLKELALSIGSFRSWNNLSRSQQKKARSTGLYRDKKPQFHFQKVYHWEQVFPKEKMVRLSHSYDPKVSEIDLNLVDHTALWKERLKVEELQTPEKARFVAYLLTKGPEWGKGIEELNLTVTGGAVIMAGVNGEIYGDLGVLKVQQKDFEPEDDLLIEFIETPEAATLQLALTEDAQCLDAPNGKNLKTFKKGEELRIGKRQDFWFWIDAHHCWIHQSGFKKE